MRTLARTEVIRRAQRVRLVLTDCDGVLTDAGVYYSEEGEAFKRYSVRDGMGMELLRVAGVETSIITRERSPSLVKRAEKLKLERVYLGVHDKRDHLDVILRETGLTLGELAYVGDDVNDLGIIEVIRPEGLTGAPKDAMPEVKRAVHYRSTVPGGHGAFRDFAEWLLRHRRMKVREQPDEEDTGGEDR